MGENSNLVQVSDLNLTHCHVVHVRCVDPVIYSTFRRVFLYNSHCFLTYSSLGLVSARAAVVSCVHARVLCKNMIKITFL